MAHGGDDAIAPVTRPSPGQPVADTRHRSPRRSTIAIRPLPSAARWAVAAGALWRLGVLVVDKWSQPLLLNDSLYYSAQARQLADGVWFREIFVDRPGAEHGPLTSTVLAVVSWVDDPVPWQRLLTVVAGILTVWAIAHLARRVVGSPAGDRAAVVAAVIAAAYPNLWMNDGLVMSESFSVLAVVALLHLSLTWVDDPPGRTGTRTLVATGVVAGLATLARSELALVAVGVVVFALAGPGRDLRGTWRRRLVRGGAVAVGAAVTVAPWVAFNLTRFERPVTLTTNDGTTLLGSSCASTFAGPELGGWSIGCVVSDPAYAMDEEPSVRSDRQRSMAIDFLREHADQLPKVVVARLARTLDLFGLDSLVTQDVGEERYRWASWSGIVAWWLLAPCAAVGLGLVRGRRRWLLLLPVGSVFATTVLFYGAHRIRSSLEPVVVVTAAIALSAGWARLRRRSRPVAGVVVSSGDGVAGPVVEEAAGEEQHDDHHRRSVEVLEVAGPPGVHEEQPAPLADEHDGTDHAGEGRG